MGVSPLLPFTLSNPQREALWQAVDALRTHVPGIAAIALGGSHASGFATSDSDLDIGLYYREAAPISPEDVRTAVDLFRDPASHPTVTGLYEWGPWVNGGGWIQTPSAGKIDLLYRNLDQLESVIAETYQNALWTHNYDQQPPFGFRSIVYLGETSVCIPLYDPQGELARLKASVETYPEAARARILQESLWGAEFSLAACRTFAARADVIHAAACFTRIAHFLIQALYAANRRYFLSDKHAIANLDAFESHPPAFTARLAEILAHPGATPEALQATTDRITALWQETIDACNSGYQPRYVLPENKLAERELL